MKKNQIDNIPSISLSKKIKGDYRFIVLVRKVESLIQFTVYCDKFKIPSVDVFIDVVNEDWLSKKYIHNGKIISEIKYSDAKMEFFINYWYHSKTYVDNESLIYEEFPFEKSEHWDVLSEIEAWQKKIREKQNDKRLEKKFLAWDKELAIFPKAILPSFEQYMRKEADGSYFMFYENTKSTKGYCSHCRKEVPLMKKPKQNETYRCPSCRVKSLLKQQSKIQTLETNWYNGAYMQKIGDTILIRMFNGHQYYRETTYDKPHVDLSETVRYVLYKDGTVSRFWYGMYNNRICRWNKNTDKADMWARVYSYYSYDWIRNVYMRNTASILKHSAWNLWKKKPCDLIRYMVIECQTKGLIEKLTKVGLFNIAKMFMEKNYKDYTSSINPMGKDLGQMLKLDKARLKRLECLDSVDHYLWLMKEKEENTIYDDDMIKDFSENQITLYRLSLLPPQMSLQQKYHYIKKQAKLLGDSYQDVYITWRDYLQMAKGNKWNLDSPILYMPKDLREKHSEAILYAQSDNIIEEVKKLEKDWPMVNEILPKMQKFAYENDQYAIVIPRNIEDIVREGHCLQHCIHNTNSPYMERISKRESYSFFLRKKSKLSLSWYTIEVEQNGNILQKRTTGDKQNKDLQAAIPFLKEYQQYFLSVMTEEDKKLGIEADKSIKRAYANMRKNKVEIRRGKFAGQLLADILEADLMTA